MRRRASSVGLRDLRWRDDTAPLPDLKPDIEPDIEPDTARATRGKQPERQLRQSACRMDTANQGERIGRNAPPSFRCKFRPRSVIFGNFPPRDRSAALYKANLRVWSECMLRYLHGA